MPGAGAYCWCLFAACAARLTQASSERRLCKPSSQCKTERMRALLVAAQTSVITACRERRAAVFVDVCAHARPARCISRMINARPTGDLAVRAGNVEHVGRQRQP